MSKRITPTIRAGVLASAVIAIICVMPGRAYAQQLPAVSFTPAAPAASIAPSSAQAVEPDPMASYWEVIGGLEFDTDGMMYGFAGPSWTKPLNDDVALTARAYVNWLQYEFEENGGTTEVRGPGLSTQIGLKFGDRNRFNFGAGPSFKWRGETFTDAAGNETDIDGDMEVGFSVGGGAYLNPTDHDNIHAIVSYDTVDSYLWSRLGYKHQITNHDWQDTWAHFLGAEGILQGNDDIRTTMLGGLVEFVHAPSSTAIMLRAGYKRSTFDVADARTGPYFGINFYRRLN